MGVDVADFLFLLYSVERRLSYINAAVFDERSQVSEDECQQQRSNVAAVYVGIGHDDDFAVTTLLDIFHNGAGWNADRFENVRDFRIVENLDQLGFLNVQDFSTQRKNCLGVGISTGIR